MMWIFVFWLLTGLRLIHAELYIQFSFYFESLSCLDRPFASGVAEIQILSIKSGSGWELIDAVTLIMRNTAIFWCVCMCVHAHVHAGSL